MADWQPIETAPRDGTFILAWGPEPVSNPGYEARQTYWAFYGEGSMAKAAYDRDEGPSGSWSWSEPCRGWVFSWHPTHWMPLPSPPAA